MQKRNPIMFSGIRSISSNDIAYYVHTNIVESIANKIFVMVYIYSHFDQIIYEEIRNSTRH